MTYTYADLTFARAHAHAWDLLDKCPWRLNTSERMIVLQLAREHGDGWMVVEDKNLRHQHNGGSLSNVREMLSRPRITSADYPIVERLENGMYRLYRWNEVAQ